MKLLKAESTKVMLAVALLVAAILAGCSAAQTDKFISGLTNFNRGVAAVDESLKQVNATLYGNCTSFVAVAQSINDLAGQCSKASPYTSVANDVIQKYCQSSQLSSNGGIVASIDVTVKSISQAKSTLAANKAACASGG